MSLYEQKKERLELRVSAAEKVAIQEKASDRNMTVTAFLIRAGLGRATRQRADVDAINLLRECAGTLKEMHGMLARDQTSEAMIRAMEMQMTSITNAISRVWNNGERE